MTSTRAAAAWTAFMAALVVGDDVDGAVAVAMAGIAGAGLVIAGFAAASRCRQLPRRSTRQAATLCALSLVAGAAVGWLNLAANWRIAAIDPALRTLIVERIGGLNARPAEAIFAGPITEEVVFRLFMMSVLAWLAYRATRNETVAFAVALVGSALIFAAPHLQRPFPDDPGLADVYTVALMTKYTLLGLPLGWIFWRWGLPYAIICHAAANATHMAFGSAALSGR